MSDHSGKAWVLGVRVLSQGAFSTEIDGLRDRLDDDPTKMADALALRHRDELLFRTPGFIGFTGSRHPEKAT